MRLDVEIYKTLQSGKGRFDLQVRFRSDARRVVLLGPSGSGKSLTLKAIAGLLRPDGGHIRIDGRTVFDAREGIDLASQLRQVGYLFQDYALFPHLSVRQNIAFGLTRGWRNPAPECASEEVDYWLDAFRLRSLAHLRPEALSGGQRQRTALARALAPRPRTLLLDEPFSALDPGLRRHMRAELVQLQSKLQVPMLLISHDPEDAEVLGEQVLHLHDGAIAAGR